MAAFYSNFLKYRFGQRFPKIVRVQSVDDQLIQIAPEYLIGQLACQIPMLIRYAVQVQIPNARIHQRELTFVRRVIYTGIERYRAVQITDDQRRNLQ